MLRKTLPVVALAVVLTWLTGLSTVPFARAQAPQARPAMAELVQQLVDARLNYGENLHRLIEYYRKVGNTQRRQWARRELKDFRDIRDRDYLPDLKPRLIPVDLASCGESDIVEDLLEHRINYRTSLTSLVEVLSAANQIIPLARARRELRDLISVNKYLYLRDADTPSPDLRAAEKIPNADLQYTQLATSARASKRITVNHYKTQLALEGLRQFICDYPNSDKIDDAAFQIAQLCTDNLKDYQRALRWYECALTWDPETQLPVNYRMARIYDKHVIDRLAALNYYQRSLQEFPRGSDRRKEIEKRINRLRGK